MHLKASKTTNRDSPRFSRPERDAVGDRLRVRGEGVVRVGGDAWGLATEKLSVQTELMTMRSGRAQNAELVSRVEAGLNMRCMVGWPGDGSSGAGGSPWELSRLFLCLVGL
jgi:hypothetical protein